jgi:hypothetical protein
MTRAILLITVTVLGAWILLPQDAPERCTVEFSEARCDAMAERAAAELGLPSGSITAVGILPHPESDGVLLGGDRVHLRLHSADGTTHDTFITCGMATNGDPACTDHPKLRPSSVTMGGYLDIPCLDSDCTTVATPHPDIDPAAAAVATPVLVSRLEIPIDHAGAFEIQVGKGSLPNGVLTEASFRFVDDWPAGVSIVESIVVLEVRSLEPDGRPFDNYYRHGWRDGTERIEAVLVFEVSRSEPGAVLSIADVVVR